MMKRKTRMLVTPAIVALTLCVVAVTQAAAAERDCKEVNATFVDVYNGGNTTTGRIGHGGILNGTTETVFTSGAFPTPVPTTVSPTGDLTVTTNRGLLKTSNVYLYDFETGFFTVMALIDPTVSTGRFAGATGVLFINGETIGTEIPITYPSGVTGEVCFARERP